MDLQTISKAKKIKRKKYATQVDRKVDAVHAFMLAYQAENAILLANNMRHVTPPTVREIMQGTKTSKSTSNTQYHLQILVKQGRVLQISDEPYARRNYLALTEAEQGKVQKS